MRSEIFADWRHEGTVTYSHHDASQSPWAHWAKAVVMLCSSAIIHERSSLYLSASVRAIETISRGHGMSIRAIVFIIKNIYI